MKSIRLLSQCLMLAGLLVATDIASASITSSVSYTNSKQQVGRLSRNGVPQDWAADEAFPGIINPTTALRYSTYAVKVTSLNYLEIFFDSLSPYTFVSAYQTSYMPNSDSTVNAGFETNWLGDTGTSGNYFGTDVLFFDVVAAINSTVMIVVNTTAAGLGLGDPFTLSVFGYPDSSYNFDPVELAVTLVPEPSTILLLLAPVAALGLRRLQSRSKKVRDRETGDALPA